MRLWPFLSVVVLAMAAGCSKPAVDHSSARGDAQESISDEGSRALPAPSPLVKKAAAGALAYGERADQFGSQAPYAHVTPSLYAVPVAMLASSAKALFGAFGVVLVVGVFDAGPVSFLTGGSGMGIVVGGLALLGFAVRSDASEEPAPKPSSKHPRPTHVDPDSPAPAPAPLPQE